MYHPVVCMCYAAPSTAPRELAVQSVKGQPSWASLSWEEPRQTNGKITGTNYHCIIICNN